MTNKTKTIIVSVVAALALATAVFVAAHPCTTPVKPETEVQP